LSETHSSQEERVATVQGGAPYGGQEAERWKLLRSLARIVGYVFLVVAVLALSLALGAGIAIAMEFLLGWPDTWAH
jgi:Mn2+/Fe2+ NRAMP family transporter